jgi:hypothetical protein
MHLLEGVWGEDNIPNARPIAGQRAGCRGNRVREDIMYAPRSLPLASPGVDFGGSPHESMSGQCMGADESVLNPLVADAFQNLDKMRIHSVPTH